MTANTSFKSVIANASTEGYAITLEESAKALAYDPESFMPAAVDDLALAPGHALLQVGQAVEVVKHALTFPSIDDYLERSLALMEQQSKSYGAGLYSSYEPQQRHRYMFIRHLGLALAIEHEELDDILDGIECAMVRGDGALKLTEFVLVDGHKTYCLDKFLDIFITAVNYWHRCKLEVRTIGIYRSNGSVRSLKLMELLFPAFLHLMLEREIGSRSPKLIRAIHDLKHEHSYFPDCIVPNIKNILSLKYAHMELPEIEFLRLEAGVELPPGYLEVEIRLERYLQFLEGGSESHDQLTHYVLSANYDLNGILHSVLQFKGMDHLTFENEQQRRASVIEFAKAMRTVMLRDASDELLIAQRGLASVFEQGSPEYQEMLQIEDSRLLEVVAKRFTPAQCVDNPALLAVCGARPVKEYEDWCQGFDEHGLVAEALYKMTDDQAYMLTVNNLNTRARMFTGDLGI